MLVVDLGILVFLTFSLNLKNKTIYKGVVANALGSYFFLQKILVVLLVLS
jgi:hypothetical protein